MNIEEILIDEEISILETLQRLDKSEKKILFVVNKGRLVGTVTDGDIRRWILSNGSLEAPVKNASNKNPKYIMQGDGISPQTYMEKQNINAVPILDEKYRVINIVYKIRSEKEYVSDALQDVPVVIMAGGKGTRLYPYTKILPKPLIVVHDLPIVEHIMNEFHIYGCQDFRVIVNHKKNMIKAYFAETNLPYNITCIDEEQPLGTGGGLSLLKGQIKDCLLYTSPSPRD